MNFSDQESQESRRTAMALVQGKDEMNLAEFPFASLRTVSDSRNVIGYEGWVVGKDGERRRQKWEVTGSTKVGLPTEFDERVFVALLAITASEGFVSPKVPFSVYQVLKIMGLGQKQKNYRKVERALDRLVGVTIFAEGAFWDNRRKAWVKTKSGFHIIEKYWLGYLEGEEHVREEEGVPGYVIWSKDIWESIEAGYIKRLDLDLFYSLERPLARRLYRFLDKRMQYQASYEIDIFDLAGRLGMTEYPKPSQVKRKLQPAFDELIDRRYLERAEVVKVQGYTRIRFTTVEEAAPRAEEAPTVGEGEPDAEEAEQEPDGGIDEEVVAALVERGLSERVARRLVRCLERARILEKIAYLEWLQAEHPGQIRNPHGWLRRAIEEDYT
ncbi:MAG: replication initiator protein A, partial [Chloroflexota bacterium]|nr:replication initiator protein A [Chloroflexota bacterium]